METASDGQDGSEAERLCKQLHSDALVMPQAQYCNGDNDKIKERFAALQVSWLVYLETKQEKMHNTSMDF